MAYEKLEVGDKVVVFWNNGNKNVGEITHPVQGAGDLWGYKADDGREFFINPYNPDFEGFERVSEGEQNGTG